MQLSDEVLAEALILTVDLSLRGADAVHLASAPVLKKNLAEFDDFILVASDNELLEAAQRIGITVFNPA